MKPEPPRRQVADAAALAEALDAGAPVRLVLFAPGALTAAAREAVDRCRAADVAVTRTSARDLERMSGTPGAELLALVGPDPEAPLETVLAGDGAVWLLCGVAYPGNCGFAIRAAEVSGAAGIAIDAPFDRAGRKMACRTAMRADRFFPVLWRPAAEVVEAARASGRRVIGIEDSGEASPWATDLSGRVLLVIGGEARGIPGEILETCDARVRIPMAGFVPSYNLQAALAMVAGERLRQELRSGD